MSDEQAEVITFLGGAAFARPVERVDTHAAIVFLEDGRAWKMKRAVTFSFLDFSTLARREQALRDELRLNRRTAPMIYEAVRPVTRDAGGRLAVDGGGQPVEWLLQMRRFPGDALYSQLAERGELDRRRIDELAEEIARFHAAAEVRPEEGGWAGMNEVVEGNAQDLARLSRDLLPADAVAAVDAASRAQLRRQRELLERRRRDGRVRHCHGDLHLRNVVLLDDRPVLFDCIEFDESFACIDVLYDLAFLVMDLVERALEPQAWMLLQRYVEITGEVEGLALMPLFIGVRAAIRAKVEGFGTENQPEAVERGEAAARARAYLALARTALEPQPVRLVAIGGRSGTGKSSVAAELAPSLGPLPGAVVVRSDVVRKRLFGRQPTERLPEEAYRPEVSERVFEEVAQLAARLLHAGRTVIADGVYGRPEQRARIEAVAASAGVPFTGIWLTAPEEMLERRVESRRHDASDADARVVRLQRAIDDTPIAWPHVRADRPLGEVAADARGLLS
ncbi:MAG TPA: AAA family ATPase [Geminicoccaceae bacterium]|nr:AAA family ATPase [Geminicoccus sp.]HMU49077.1 AAA family ATPase [Geminicoccaceae bacterium]